MTQKRWIYPLISTGDLLDDLLAARGLTAEAGQQFLNLDYEADLFNPFLLAGMEPAVTRLLTAISNGEKVLVFGDYDADGIPATAVLTEFFTKIGFTSFSVYIPDRHNEDHGLSLEVVENFAKSGGQLIVTVDCGIANLAEAKRAKELGLGVIITDHHLLSDLAILDLAEAVVNPKRPDDNYPEKMLCGAGVAYKLVQALIIRGREILSSRFGVIPLGWEKWLLDLVAIATVSDMVPLTGENRALVHFGLKVLRRSPRVGIQQLCRVCKINQTYLTEDDIAFLIAPKLNAASRMTHGFEAYQLLTTTDEGLAGAIAEGLEKSNRARRSKVDDILLVVEKAMSENQVNVQLDNQLLVFGQADWSLGVLGLAAARLVEKYSRPTFIWGQNSRGMIKGSCRSDGQINVVELMRAANNFGEEGDNYFSNFGGHALAGGFSVPPGRAPELAKRLNRAYKLFLPSASTEEELVLDVEFELDRVNEATCSVINRLAPFGLGNPKPNLLFRALPIKGVKVFGQSGNHLELVFGGIKAIKFFAEPNEYQALVGKNSIDLVANLEESYFRGRRELRLRIVDWRPAS